MKLQHATRYAIWSVLELASRPGESISAGELAAKYDISQHHLAKVLRILTRARIVSSSRGPGGGFVFSGKANRLTINDVIALFEGDFLSDDSSVSSASPIAEEVGRVLNEIDRITSATLRSVTVATVIKNAERARKSAEVAAEAANEGDGHDHGDQSWARIRPRSEL